MTSTVSKVLGGGGGAPAPLPAPTAPAMAPAVPDAPNDAVARREAKRRQAAAAGGVTPLGGSPRRSNGVATKELLG